VGVAEHSEDRATVAATVTTARTGSGNSRRTARGAARNDQRHWLFVESFSPARIERFLRELINNIEARDWDEAATKLGRLAHYEFEDYTG
jgi:Immunity protein 8